MKTGVYQLNGEINNYIWTSDGAISVYVLFRYGPVHVTSVYRKSAVALFNEIFDNMYFDDNHENHKTGHFWSCLVNNMSRLNITSEQSGYRRR